MTTKEDTKKEDLEQSEGESPADATEGSASSEGEAADAPADALVKLDDKDGDAMEVAGAGPVAAPTQLGHKRFVYAAYFAGAIGIAFLLSKVTTIAWGRLAVWKPMLGEPRDDILMPASAILGAAAALYYWRRTRARELAEQVAEELSKVTWPSRQEVTNSTFVVIVATLVSTVFFALMDRFWGFVTNLVYGT